MLCALAITLLVQNPVDLGPLESSGYYEALHQLEVRGGAEAALPMFEWLAVAPELQEHPALRGIVLAQAYRANMLLGRRARADELRTQVLELTEGTDYEAAAKEILAAARTAATPQQDVDDDFLKLVKETLQEGRAVETLGRYGRRVLPYLQVALEDEIEAYYRLRQLRRGEEAEPLEQLQPSRNAVRVGLRLATDAFTDALWALLENRTPAFTESLLGGTLGSDSFRPVDAEAEAANDRLLLRLLDDADVRRARLGAEWAARQFRYRRSPALEERLAVVLRSPDDILAPFLVDSLPFRFRSKEDPEPPLFDTALPLLAARSPQDLVARTARWRLVSEESVPELANLARDGSRLDRLRFLIVLLGDVFSQEQSEIRDAVHREVWEAGQGEIRGSIGNVRVPDLEPYRDLLLRLAGDTDLTLRLAAGLAIVSQADAEGTLRLLAAGDDELAQIAVTGIRPEFSADERFRAALLPLLENPELERSVTEALLRAGGQLTPPELLAVAAHVDFEGDGARASAIAEVLRNWVIGRSTDRLRAVLGAEEAPRPLRAMAFSYLMDPSLDEGRTAFSLLEEVPESSREQLGRNLVRTWLPVLAENARATQRVDQVTGDAFVALLPFADQGRRRGGNPSSFGRALLTLLDADADRGIALFERLAATEAGAETLIDTLNDRDHPYWSREGAPYLPKLAAVLVRLHPFETSNAVWSLLTSPTHPQRFDAVPELLRSSNPAHVNMGCSLLLDVPGRIPDHEDDLLRLLQNPAVAATAARVLSRLGGQFVPQLLEAWAMPELEERKDFADALGWTADERIVPALLEGLRSSDPGIYAASKSGLARLKAHREEREYWEAWQSFGTGSSPTAALLLKTRSENPEVRIAAIRSLGTLKAKEALPVLVELLEDEDEQVVAAARDALGWING